jgi:hypothetical protein
MIPNVLICFKILTLGGKKKKKRLIVVMLQKKFAAEFSVQVRPK